MFNFPSSPVVGQVYTVGNRTWVWNGTVWALGSSYKELRTPISPDSKPLVPNAMDDEFEGSTLDAKWAWRNQETASVSLANGSLVISSPAHGVATGKWRGLEQPLPASGTWKYRAKITTTYFGDATAQAVGLALVNSTNGRLINLFTNKEATSGNMGWALGRYTSVTVWSANIYYSAGAALSTQSIRRYGLIQHGFKYFEIEWDGTNYYFRVSATGVEGSFVGVGNDLPGTFLGTADKIALLVDSTGEDTKLICDWFRRIT